MRDSLLKVDITSSELRTDSIMIFSTISCGNLLHAFELMSVCASTWWYADELLSFWSTLSRLWRSGLWGSASYKFGGFSSCVSSLFSLSTGFTGSMYGLRKATLYFFDNSTPPWLRNVHGPFLEMLSTIYGPCHL